MADNRIKLLIVDDSLFFREFLSRMLKSSRTINVISSASNALEAEEKIKQLKPDVVSLDIEMPGMSGTEFLRKILPKYPGLKVVVISADPGNVFSAMQSGAIEFSSKPNSRPDFDKKAFLNEITEKIKIAYYSNPICAESVKPPVKSPKSSSEKNDGRLKNKEAAFSTPAFIEITKSASKIIAMGASTGGTEALIAVLKAFPANAPPVVIVQHMPPVFTDMYAKRIDNLINMKAKEARDGCRLEQGLVLVAPGDFHMTVVKDASGYFVRCRSSEKVSGHRPSVDVLFSSVAKAAGKNAVGAIFTGMGADGARGLLEMKEAGAYTIGQDEATCVVYGMPMVAYNIGAVTEQLPLGKIGQEIMAKL